MIQTPLADHPRRGSGGPRMTENKPGIDSPVFSLSVTTGHGKPLQVSLSADVLADLFRSVPDSPEMGWLFDLAARHPAMKVRCAVAGYDNLSPETVRLLADDTCSEIRRQLVSSPALKRLADTEMVLHLAASDPAVAEELAEQLYDFTGCCIPQVEAYLCRRPDPSVRLLLAQNGEVSLRTLAALVDDADPGVAVAALRQTRVRLGGSKAPELVMSN